MNASRLFAVCAFVVLGGCSASDPDGENPTREPTQEPTPTPVSDEPLDLRREFPAPPAGGIQFLTPALTIPAYSEKQWCYFTRYTGEDTGIHAAYHYQSDYGHHVVLMGTTADEQTFPDGSLFDCTTTDAISMADMEPIYIMKLEGHDSSMVLPGDMAVKMKKGRRIIIQSHYLNTSARDIVVQDAMNLELMKPEEVYPWAAPFANAAIDFALPVNQASTVNIRCEWEYDLNILYLQGHLHEHGRAFSVDHITSAETRRIYEVPEWTPEYRDTPPIDEFEPGEFPVAIGDIFSTDCTWFNDTDHEIYFPEEMCAFAGMVYPATVPLICAPG